MGMPSGMDWPSSHIVLAQRDSQPPGELRGHIERVVAGFYARHPD